MIVFLSVLTLEFVAYRYIVKNMTFDVKEGLYVCGHNL